MSMFQSRAETVVAPASPRFLHRLAARLAIMVQVYRERQALALLDERDLRDIRVNRLEARTEARRHFWDLPPMA